MRRVSFATRGEVDVGRQNFNKALGLGKASTSISFFLVIIRSEFVVYRIRYYDIAKNILDLFLHTATFHIKLQQTALQIANMISLKTVFSLLFLVASIANSALAKKKDDEEQALRDVQLGLQGLKEATQNPAMLAQMMRDLQVCYKSCD